MERNFSPYPWQSKRQGWRKRDPSPFFLSCKCYKRLVLPRIDCLSGSSIMRELKYPDKMAKRDKNNAYFHRLLYYVVSVSVKHLNPN